MENGHNLDPAKQTNTEDLPTLLKKLASREVPGFDYDEDKRGMTMQRPALRMRMQGTADGHAHTAEFIHSDVQGTDAEATKSQANVIQSPETVVSFKQSRRNQSVSISMPTSPSVLHMETAKRVQIVDEAEQNAAHGQVAYGPAKGCANNPQRSKQMFHSQPMSAGTALGKSIPRGTAPDRRFNSFKTWSGKLERQISNLRGKQQPTEPEPDGSVHAEPEGALSVDRYYDALQGPELDILKPSEEAALPEDKQWPFLLRFPISSFGICLGVSSQAILWKTLATSPSTEFLRVSPSVNVTLWCASLVLMSCVSSVYALKIIFYFEAVRREYYHPIRVNFFFAPWIACLFLSIGVPPSVSRNLPAALWYVLMAPILCLELKIYGQWMSGGQRRLSKVANPSNHLSIVGNFVGALLGASMGLKEGPIFFFAVGLAHYTVLFVTLYQRLPTNETLPKELHPVFFLFVAAPSVACMAWAKINGDFNYGSRVAYFIALFLYASLAVRINFFRGFRFSLAWWAYTFPMTGAAIATIGYSTEVKNPLTQALSLALSAISTFTVTALLVSTIIHAFVLGDLFPNDISIAITEKRQQMSKKCSSPEKMDDAGDSFSIDLQEQQLGF